MKPITYFELSVRVVNPELGKNKKLVELDVENFSGNYTTMEKAKSRVQELYKLVDEKFTPLERLEFRGNLSFCHPMFFISGNSLVSLDISIRQHTLVIND